MALQKDQARVLTHGGHTMRPTGRRVGITLIELLVAVSIVGILIALLMPAVQYAREASRRLSCQNNLRQLGIACTLYHDASRCLPISVTPFQEGPSPELGGGGGKGWIVSVLPYLEQEPLFRALEPGFQGSFFAGDGMRTLQCRSAVQTELLVLHCPSDDSVRGLSTIQFEWEPIPVAMTSYKGVIGDSQLGGLLSKWEGSLPDCHSSGGCNGLFYRGSGQAPVGFNSCTDGQSNTLMIGEDVPMYNRWSAAYYANGDWASCHGPINYFPLVTPSNEWWNNMTFRSRHPEGAQFVLADGAVRFLSEQIDRALYRALSTRHGNEVASVP